MKKLLFTAFSFSIVSISFCQTKPTIATANTINNILAVNTLSNSITISPKVITFPVLTSAAIDALPLPKEGMFVYDQTEGCLKQHNGSFWSCIGSRKSVFILNGPITLDESHSVLIMTTSSPISTITLPAASGFTGKEFRIVNHTAGTITCSQYRSGVSTPIFINSIPSFTEVLLISDGIEWRKIN
jgi:hypothetical protein